MKWGALRTADRANKIDRRILGKRIWIDSTDKGNLVLVWIESQVPGLYRFWVMSLTQDLYVNSGIDMMNVPYHMNYVKRQMFYKLDEMIG